MGNGCELCYSFVAFGVMFATGVIFGWFSAVTPLLITNTDSALHATEGDIKMFMNFSYIGRISGLICVALTLDRIGRAGTIRLVYLMCTVKWLIIYLATTIRTLQISRIFSGFGATIAMLVLPIYLAEISSPKYRAIVSSLMQVFLLLGIMCSYAVVPYVSVTTSALVFLIQTTLFGFAFLMLPESPYYLIIRGKQAKAEIVLKKLRGNRFQEDEFHQIEEDVKSEMSNKTSPTELFKNPGHIRALYIALGVLIIQIFSGNICLIAFTHITFQRLSMDLPINLLAIIETVLRFATCALCSMLVPLLGNKRLLVISTGLVSVNTLYLAILQHMWTNKNNNMIRAWIGVGIIYGFHFSFCLGLAAVPATLLGELFPANIKRYAVTLCMLCELILEVAVLQVHYILINRIEYVPYYFYSVSSFLGLIFILVLVPDNSKATLHEIQLKLGTTFH